MSIMQKQSAQIKLNERNITKASLISILRKYKLSD